MATSPTAHLQVRALVSTIQAAKYLRIASIAIAAYDYVTTIPAEFRFYRSQRSLRQPSLACVLFFLIRYVSLSVMIVSNYGAFSSNFTRQSCARWSMVAPVFKVLQTIISQAILAVRTYNIARRKEFVKYMLVSLFISASAIEGFVNLYKRIPVLEDGGCTTGSNGVIAFAYYIVSMVYDAITLGISTVFLLKYRLHNGTYSSLIKVMIVDGLGYFVILTAQNIVNAIIYSTAPLETQNAGVSLGYAVTWIMSQGLLLHLRELSQKRISEAMVVSQQLATSKSVAQAVRQQFERRDELNLKEDGSLGGDAEHDLDLGLEVRVERQVEVHYNDRSFGSIRR